ncbi:tRNA wybutosine-synthesizing protein 4 isoform X2 [Nilaparvata lugens]|nr:tRNA wybutosine-synthesizing protein 4 isoform X2 [Nilaparvata lugens]
MVDRGYFEDKYIHYFVEKTSRRSPIINIGYFVRAAVINSVLKDFVNSLSGDVQIVSFGAGFDTSYFRLYDLSPRCSISYFEIDLSNVVKRKKKIILKSKDLLEKLENVEDSTCDALKSSNYNLLVCDLCDIPKTQKCLVDSGFNQNLPTLFLAECSITYMKEKSSTELINWAGSFVRNGTFVTYEQINPYDGFGLKMTTHFMMLQSPLLSLSKYPTMAAQKQRYEGNGWSNCNVVPAWTAFTNILSVEEIHSSVSLEPFDEWEEWHLKCNHYSLAVARNGTLNDWQPSFLNLSSGEIVNDSIITPTIDWKPIECPCIQRYAHTSVLFGKRTKHILTIGGFGTFNNRHHKRFNDAMCCEYPLGNETLDRVKRQELTKSGFIHHSCTVITGDDFQGVSVVIYGGRTSPDKAVNSCPLLLNCSVEEGGMMIESKELVESESLSVEMPGARWRHSACVMDVDSGKWFVVYGGCSSELKIFDDLWILKLPAFNESTETIKWICASNVSDSLVSNIENKPKPRFSHSSAVWKADNMIVTCGLGANNKVFNDAWKWNFKRRLWEKLEICGMLPRYAHTGNIVGSNLLLVGGVSTMCGVTPGVTVINLKLLTCHEYQLPYLDPSTPVMLHNHSTIYDGDKEALVVIGGGGNCFSFGTHLNSHFVEIPLRQFQS